jgi:pimeloyl-ACP methyl ester carboxylesterase
MFCFHGNSNSSLTFNNILKTDSFNVVAVDLPGCGKSDRLQHYSMDELGELMGMVIRHFNPKGIVVLFGHSLGGHLLTYIPFKADLYILSGTPPLSGPEDFPHAFKPDSDAQYLIPYLSDINPFSHENALKFTLHYFQINPDNYKTNKNEYLLLYPFLDEMIESAEKTDGKFRQGCLTTLTDKNQIDWMYKQGIGKTLIFHALNDGVINPDYLESLPKSLLAERKIHYVNGPHISPLTQYDEILKTITRIVGIY